MFRYNYEFQGVHLHSCEFIFIKIRCNLYKDHLAVTRLIKTNLEEENFMGLCFLGQKKWSCHGIFFNNIIKIETDLGDKPLNLPP
jgi:hypothetical protein